MEISHQNPLIKLTQVNVNMHMDIWREILKNQIIFIFIPIKFLQ